MTQQNKKINISQELERAKDCLKSAELLMSHGQYADAVSRLYYYVYHNIRALLLSRGFEPKTKEDYDDFKRESDLLNSQIIEFLQKEGLINKSGTRDQ